jgi:NhaP-type Na+/H+ or K+/H+ antiporter
MTQTAIGATALALMAGTLAQAVAARLGLPSIVLLLATGFLLGPDFLGLLDPSALAGGRETIVSLAVTIILFEGGLALDLDRLRRQQRSLLLLVTLGGAISMILGTLAARYAVGFSWSVSLLYGSLMIVTGPTVVTPLLSRLKIERRLRELLISEGVLIDPIGAIVALVAAEWVVGHAGLLESGWLVVLRLSLGAAAGFASGVLLATALKRQWIPEHLINPTVLGITLAIATFASGLSAEAGLMAAVAQGVTMANRQIPGIGKLRDFKEALTLILLAFLFVTLAAGLRLEHVEALGWNALIVVACLIWIARPLGVFLATHGSEMPLRERVFAAWICPRGIVAAAIAGLFHLQLQQSGIPGGAALEALVFVTVACTVTLQGLTARPVARLLKIDFPSLLGTVIIGADAFSRKVGRLLTDLGRPVVHVDRNPALCERARAAKLVAIEGDALSLETLEAAGARYADVILALTGNNALNDLALQKAGESFMAERYLGLGSNALPNEEGVRPDKVLFPGNFPGIQEASRLTRLDKLEIKDRIATANKDLRKPLRDLPYAPGEFAVALVRNGAVNLATGELQLVVGDMLYTARVLDQPSPLDELFAESNQGPAKPHS